MSTYNLYTVVTSSTCITHYKVRARSKKDAKNKMYTGEYNTCKNVHFKDEIIQKVNIQKEK